MTNWTNKANTNPDVVLRENRMIARFKIVKV